MTIKEIKEDLKEIKYYYSMKDLFSNNSPIVNPTAIMEKVDRYTKAMESAPAKLLAVYIEMYVNNNTQTSLADKWCYGNDYVYQLHCELCKFLLKTLQNQ